MAQKEQEETRLHYESALREARESAEAAKLDTALLESKPGQNSTQLEEAKAKEAEWAAREEEDFRQRAEIEKEKEDLVRSLAGSKERELHLPEKLMDALEMFRAREAEWAAEYKRDRSTARERAEASERMSADIVRLSDENDHLCTENLRLQAIVQKNERPTAQGREQAPDTNAPEDLVEVFLSVCMLWQLDCCEVRTKEAQSL